MARVPIRVFVADDEDLARQRLRYLLARISGIDLVGEASSGIDAVRQVAVLKPDILLLDIDMPGSDGFETLSTIGDKGPLPILVSGHAHHAIRAFETPACDYLLKPVSLARLALALGRARRRIERAATYDAGEQTQTRQALEATPFELWATSHRQRRRIALDLIELIEAQRDYARIYTAEGSFFCRHSIGALEERLDPERFIRIHRSTIIRRDLIVAVTYLERSGLSATLGNGRILSIGRTYVRRIRDMMER